MGHYVSAMGLTDRQIEDIHSLEEICGRYEQLNMKLNWDMLESRSADKNEDFLYYEGGTLAGFLGLYDIQQKSREIEITGMVHPDFRRKGIFKELFNMGRQKCEEINAERLLLISERSKSPGIKFSEWAGGRYSFSEFRMKFESLVAPHSPITEIFLKKAGVDDYPMISSTDAECFDEHEDENLPASNDDLYKDTFIAELKGKAIGKIGLLKEGGDGYIFGFAVKPEFRGNGYGRAILCLGIEKLLNEKAGSIYLEVALENDRALSLYKSCGFNEVTVYDYYELLLRG